MFRTGLVWCALLAGLASAQELPPPAKSKVDFGRDVAPLFAKRCQMCHGAQQQMSGLRLDQREAALKGGAAGVDIRPGDSANSRLIRLVAGVDKKVMPPAGAKLTAEEIGVLRAWIDQGAVWGVQPAVHWSFQKIQRPPVPAVKNRAWVRNPVDAFILARLEKEGIEPSPEADRLTLLRRVSLDLTGLPPSPEQIREYLADTRDGAYERAVDRLLDSPHYGEKWARYWLDLARYADSDGYEKDRARPWAWRYRQWVIEAFNRDLPFDQFTIQQLAGDLLPDRNLDTLVATGFNRNTLTNREGGTDPEQFRHEQVLDRAATLGTVWLGLTTGCAQCHNHKYDPISQKEFYQLTAFFNTQEEVNIMAPMPGEAGPYLAARPEFLRRKNALFETYEIYEAEADWESKLREAATNPGHHEDWDFAYGELTHNVDSARKVLFMDPAKRTEVQQTQMMDYFLSGCGNLYPKEHCEELKLREVRTTLNEWIAKLPPLSYAPVLLESDSPPKTYIHIKGDWRDRGAEVQPGTLAVLPPMPQGPEPPRVRLAKWLVAPDHPLTSRVAVNRLWQEVFGRGIVFTSSDFGTQGDRPTHPELLDWLATEYMQRKWSTKQMVRLLVTSATYRQSSKARPELESKDPSNTLLALQSRLRLPAELIRDSALYAAGLLDPRVGGPSVRPAQPKGVAELSYAGSVKWVESTGVDRYRRGMYILFQRTVPYPMLMTFDAPDSNLSCTRRERTDTPLQALNLMNDPVFFEAAQGLAFRILRESAGPFRERLKFAFDVTVGRPPSEREAARLTQYYNDSARHLETDTAAVNALFPNQIEGVPQREAASWVELSRVLLNLDEFITRE
jgi:Protein of unknown function (DUF1553)/Protein of unknown function (DUF1549)/Planctomycete cytochrome C